MPDNIAPSSKPKQSGDDVAWLAFFALLVGIVIAIPTIVSLLVWMVAQHYVNRKISVALILVGTTWWFFSANTFVTKYFFWGKDLFTGNFQLWDFPWLMLVATSAILVGVMGLISSTSVKTHLPAKLFRPAKNKSIVADNNLADDFIMPNKEEKTKMSIPVPDGGTLTIDATSHSVDQATEPGKRRFPIGIDQFGRAVMLSENEIRMHGIILGSTGSGKSKTIEALAGCLLDLGWSGMLLDLKEDTAPGGLRDWCATYAQTHAMPFQELRLSDANSPWWFNPLHGMGPDEIRDTILTLSTFDDAYWQALNKEMLGQAVNLIYWAHTADPINFPTPTMYEIGKMLSHPNGLNKATKKHRAVVLSHKELGVTEEDFRVLEQPTKPHEQSAGGFGAKLTQIYDTQAGRVVLRPDYGGVQKRLVDVTKPGLTYIGLDSQGKADLTKVISSAILQRMSVYAAQRTTGQVVGDRAPRFLIVDEANWVDRTIIQNLLSRARSAGIAMFLCTQGPRDWIDKDGDDWAKLTQNVNIAIIMSQGEYTSAEMCAEYLGKTNKTLSSTTRRINHGSGVFGQTEHVDSSESLREMKDYIVDPDQLRSMGIGEAIIRVGKPEVRMSWAKVQLRDPAGKVDVYSRYNNQPKRWNRKP